MHGVDWSNGVLAADGVPALACPAGAAEAFVVLELFRRSAAPLVWVTPGLKAMERAHQDLLTLAGADAAAVGYFPPWDALPGQDVQEDPELAGLRLGLLHRLHGDPQPVLAVTCAPALLQRVPGAASWARAALELTAGAATERDEVAGYLARTGYRMVAQVGQKGEAAVRGGIVDVWPPPSRWPVRVEFSGSDVESLRWFDPEDQHSVGRPPRVTLLPASEWAILGTDPAAAGGGLADHLPAGTVRVWSGWSALCAHATSYAASAREAGAEAYLVPGAPAAWPWPAGGRDIHVGLDLPDGVDAVDAGLTDLQGVVAAGEAVLQPDLAEHGRRRLLAELRTRAEAGDCVTVYLDTPGARDHFLALLGEIGVTPGSGEAPGIAAREGTLSAGFACPALRRVVVAEADLYGARKEAAGRYQPVRGGRAQSAPGRRIGELSELEPGDLVVHVDHGLGRYLGLFEILFDGREQEVLSIEYAEGARLHVPVSHAHLLTRYVGVGGHATRLHRLGGRRWKAERAAAEQAVADLAASLLETQAHRDLLRGHAFPPDTRWQHEFDASFPFRETVDQTRVIAEVKTDMESPRPMDRLVCGDAGYGKTEIAMRAAFKAVMDHRQVAMLVPTTVLAQQHGQTFCARMAPYPVRIEVLSRFQTRGQQARVAAGLADGTIDIVIGTHALLHGRIRFKDLGLLIVDEEQRFGVAHKEQLKHLRRLVDVLTLTATPIPRTLYMSMTGAREMSLLQTPPGERMAVETIVTRRSDDIVRKAILREHNRDGQTFYLHNRVMTIDRVHRWLRELVPEVRIGVGHGRMAARELAAVMKAFARGEYDVLLCTTIIESGLDIPRANTILIDRADRFGIADLYQLRGRVGRSNRKACAYLLLPEQGRVDPDARSRIGALRKYGGLGAGFSLAMRDLELRGAGNLLGREQSGHIASVGFTLYCQLLKRTIAVLKGEAPPRIVDVALRLDFVDLAPSGRTGRTLASIPYDYVEEEGQRIGLYKDLAEASTHADLERVRTGLRDRFGPIPAATERLLAMAELRILAAERGMASVEVRGEKIMMVRDGDFVMEDGRFPRLPPETTATDARLAAVRARITAEPRTEAGGTRRQTGRGQAGNVPSRRSGSVL